MLPRRLSTNQSYQPRGGMNTRIQLLKPNTTRDSSGELLPPDVFLECWARVQTLAPKYTEKTEQVVTEANILVIMPYVPGVTSAMLVKVVEDGSVMEIKNPNDPQGTKVELYLQCYLRNDGRTPQQ